MGPDERPIGGYICPSCHERLPVRRGDLVCPQCGRRIRFADGYHRFPLPEADAPVDAGFDRLAAVYESPLWFQLIYRLIGGPRAPRDDRRALLRPVDWTDRTVLDVACGTGRFVRGLAPDAACVIGVDRSPGMLRRAVTLTPEPVRPGVHYARMDATGLYLADRSVDAVTCGWALHLFDRVENALVEIHRVLRPGGWFAATTLAPGWLLSIPGLAPGLRATVGARTFSDRELRTILETVGFGDVDLHRHGAAWFVRARR